MKKYNLLKAIIIFLMMGASTIGYIPTADEIISKADERRLISDSFEMKIRVESYLNNRFEGLTVMKGRIDNGEMTALYFLEPLNMKGRKIIIEGNDMRLIIPKVKNPIRITPSQRLIGGISCGDIAAVSYGKGYTAETIGEKPVAGMNSDGFKSDPGQCFILELTAKESKQNYQRIIIWVDQQNYFPVKADFFALSGKKMTTVYYTAPREWNGKTIVTKMFLYDQVNTAKYFAMEYSDFNVIQSIDGPQ